MVPILGSGCTGCDSTGGDPRVLIPADATGALVVPKLERLRVASTDWLGGVEGGAGVFELIEARYGVALTTAEGLSEAGLSPDSAAVAFVHGDLLIVAAGLTSAARFDVRIRDQLIHRLNAEPTPATGRTAGTLGEADGPKDASGQLEWRMAWGAIEGAGAIGWIAVSRGDIAPAAGAMAAFDAAKSGGNFIATVDAKAAESLSASEGGALLWAVGHWAAPIPANLGLAQAFVQTMADGLSRWQVAVGIDGGRLVVRTKGVWSGEGELPAGWIQPAGDPMAIGDLLPRRVVGALRGRIDLSRARKIPSFIRNRVIPKAIPGMNGPGIPTPAALLDLLTGEFAVVALGLDGDATVDHLMRPGSRLKAGLRIVHSAFIGQVRDPTKLPAALSAARVALEAARWTVAEIAPITRKIGGPPTLGGLAIRKGQDRFAVLVDGDRLIVLSGGGEVAGFHAVAQGEAVPLASLVEGDAPIITNALGGPGGASFGMVATFARVTRELAEKGLPPFFLRMIGQFRAVAATLTPSADGVSLVLEVRR